MDVIRKDAGRKRMIRRIVYISIVVITVPLITWALSRLKPAAPSVEMATLWPDTVKRGHMKVDRRGLGTLVPEETLFIPAIYRRPRREASGAAGRPGQAGYYPVCFEQSRTRKLHGGRGVPAQDRRSHIYRYCR